MLKSYFKKLYQRTMKEAYSLAEKEILSALQGGGKCLDCGANTGSYYFKFSKQIELTKDQYHGIEWNQQCVDKAQEKGFNVVQGDLNKLLPYDDNIFDCIYGLSLIERYGFGLYPLPDFMQPLAEKIDPYHCHQMVFIAQK